MRSLVSAAAVATLLLSATAQAHSQSFKPADLMGRWLVSDGNTRRGLPYFEFRPDSAYLQLAYLTYDSFLLTERDVQDHPWRLTGDTLWTGDRPYSVAPINGNPNVISIMSLEKVQLGPGKVVPAIQYARLERDTTWTWDATMSSRAPVQSGQARSIKMADLAGKWVVDNEMQGDTLVIGADSTFYWVSALALGTTAKRRWDYIGGDTLAMNDGACVAGTKTCTGDERCLDATGSSGLKAPSHNYGGDCFYGKPGYRVTLRGKKLTFTRLQGLFPVLNFSGLIANTFRQVD